MLKKYSKIIILMVCVFSFLVIMISTNLLNISSLAGPNSEDTHYNLITINSVIAGFMFTSLSLILSVANSDTIRRLERTIHMDFIYNNITGGILNSIISIVTSLVSIFIVPNCIQLITNTSMPTYIKESVMYLCNVAIPFTVLYTLVVAIGCFLMSVLDVKFIIKSIRRKLLKEAPDKESLKETLNLIK